MYFEVNDPFEGTYLSRVSFLKGIYILLFNIDKNIKFVPWWKIEKF